MTEEKKPVVEKKGGGVFFAISGFIVLFVVLLFFVWGLVKGWFSIPSWVWLIILISVLVCFIGVGVFYVWRSLSRQKADELEKGYDLFFLRDFVKELLLKPPYTEHFKIVSEQQRNLGNVSIYVAIGEGLVDKQSIVVLVNRRDLNNVTVLINPVDSEFSTALEGLAGRSTLHDTRAIKRYDPLRGTEETIIERINIPEKEKDDEGEVK